ncbi:MAG: HesA/MoeB/ThiF family protein [Phycisphaerales bacterium]|jgi:molybdopterin-synthase adenylyltransferase|nr:HesA/MoeB/ThiF family protein [Phycisphaerales bacterium]
MSELNDNMQRYHRQMAFGEIGLTGQRTIQASSAIIVGVGGLGSWIAELLVRSGVGRLIITDNDKVDITNIHRQGLYDQSHADAAEPKVTAAARRLAEINPAVTIEPRQLRLDAGNIAELVGRANLIIDGTDNFHTRFIINDYAVKHSLPWIFAGVVSAEAQIMSVIPGQTACLRCVFDAPPPPCSDPTCRQAGVLGPAVATIASMQAIEAVKILSGRSDAISPVLTKFNFWANTIQRISATKSPDCPCCAAGHFDYLNA